MRLLGLAVGGPGRSIAATVDTGKGKASSVRPSELINNGPGGDPRPVTDRPPAPNGGRLPSVTEVVRVMLVDDHRVVRAGMELLLGLEPGIDVVASAGSAAQAMALIGQVPVDVVVMDVIMPGMDGIEATRIIRTEHPGVEVLMLSSYQDAASLKSAMSCGARGFLLKSVGGDDLVEAILSASRGRATIDPSLVPLLFGESDEVSGASDLTDRERQVLSELATGRTNHQIADRLAIQPGTVRVYVSHILDKLGAANRTEAAAIALRHKLVVDEAE